MIIAGIVKELALWVHGIFVEILSYFANALLEILNMDTAYFENNVPAITDFYEVILAIGWGFLIGNCIFQCMKAMFAGLGFETESPVILLGRTFIFAFLLYFSYPICDLLLSVGRTAVNLIGMPDEIEITMPTESSFGFLDVSWAIVTTIGFIVGIQLIKLFFEVAERYAVVVIMILFSPLAFAMGGSRSTKDIFSGYMRTFVSMLILFGSSSIFLKLVFSALGAMPTGMMALPWALLVVGITKTAKKADNLLTKIGLTPQLTGDPLGNGGGKFALMIAARTALSRGFRSHNGNQGNGHTGGKNGTQNYSGSNNYGTSNNHGGGNYRNTNINRNNNSQNNRQNNINDIGTTQNSGAGHSFSQNNGGVKTGSTQNSASFNSVGGENRYKANTGTKRNTPANTNKPNGEKRENSQRQNYKNGNTKNKKPAGLTGVKHNTDRNFKTFGKTDTIRSNPNAFKRFGSGERPPDTEPETEGENDV